MAKMELKEEAKNLRRAGYSILSIAYKLSISKSTASLWCRDIVLTNEQIENIMKKSKDSLMKGRMLGAEMNRQKRLRAMNAAEDSAREKILTLSSKDMLLIAIALYWAEGSKSEYSTGFQFVNSDPVMILGMKKVLLLMDVKNEELCCTIQINETHRSRIEIVLNFWKNLLEFNNEQVGNTSFVKTIPKKVYENHDTYFGICRLKVRKSTKLKYEIVALIQALKSKIMSV